MKFFTRAWVRGEMGEAESGRTMVAYQEHLAAISARLPNEFAHFARCMSVHDALFRSFAIDHDANAVLIGLRCGDRQSGYHDLDLFYGMACLIDCQLSELTAAVNSEDTEVLYDEVDAPGEGVLKHSFILWPEGEFTVQFESFRMHHSEVENRVLDGSGNRFHGS